MKYNPDIHHRRSVRLMDYDYSQTGAYFVTIVTQGRTSLFGEVVDGEICLNDAGRMAEKCWHDIPSHFPNVQLDAFVVMPNHVHGIVVIGTSVGAPLVGAQTIMPNRATTRGAPTLGDVVGAYKSRVTVEYTRGIKTKGWPTFIGRVWQRNYYEQILRNEESLNQIRQYIVENPAQWAFDRENPVGASLVGGPNHEVVLVGGD